MNNLVGRPNNSNDRGRNRRSRAVRNNEPRQARQQQQDVLASMASIRHTIDMLEKRETLLHRKITQTLKEAMARKKRGDKGGALRMLKKKKMYEKHLERLLASRNNLEAQLLALESSSINQDIAQGFVQANAALQGVLSQVNVDRVEDLQDEVAEQMAQVDEVGELLAEDMNLDNDFDEDALLAELEEMSGEENLDQELERGVRKPKLAAQNTVAEPEEPLALPAAPAAAEELDEEERQLLEEFN